MESSNENISVYAEAKSEYTRQLGQFLVPALQTYFLGLLEDAKQKDTDPKKLIWNFQDLLKEMPDWNVDKVKRETARIKDAANCDYLEELLTAVFIAHTKVLSAIRLTTKNKKLQITIPKEEHFIHRAMCDSARLLWSNAYLFNPSVSSVERQKNINQIEELLREGLLQSIRSMLPVKSILREYLHEENEEEEDEKVKEVKEEVKEEPKEEIKEIPKEEPKEIPKEEPKEEVKEIPKAEPPAATFFVDTEPTVRFANIDSVFDAQDPEMNTFQPSSEEDSENIEILDMSGSEMDGFDTIEDEDTAIEYDTL